MLSLYLTWWLGLPLSDNVFFFLDLLSIRWCLTMMARAICILLSLTCSWIMCRNACMHAFSCAAVHTDTQWCCWHTAGLLESTCTFNWCDCACAWSGMIRDLPFWNGCIGSAAKQCDTTWNRVSLVTMQNIPWLMQWELLHNSGTAT